MTDEQERLRYRHSIIQADLEYRRSRRSAIFTWASSVLIAVTGGVMTLQLNSGQTLSDGQRIILSSAVLVLGGYAALWWEKQRRRGKSLHLNLNAIDAALAFEPETGAGGVLDKIGGLVAIVLLTLTALAAIWSSTVAF